MPTKADTPREDNTLAALLEAQQKSLESLEKRITQSHEAGVHTPLIEKLIKTHGTNTATLGGIALIIWTLYLSPKVQEAIDTSMRKLETRVEQLEKENASLRRDNETLEENQKVLKNRLENREKPNYLRARP